MTLVLKVDLDGDVRRFRIVLPENADTESKWSLIESEVRLGYQLAEDADLVLKYRDDEGDLCTLVQETLTDYLTQAAAGGPLRLIASTASTAPPEGPAEAGAAGADGADGAAAGAASGEMDPEKMMEMMWQVKKIMRMARKAGKGCGKGGEDQCKRRMWQQEGMPEEHWGWHKHRAHHHCRQEHVAGHCPAGHELTPQHGAVCDVCNMRLADGGVSMGCRMCDWDICEACQEPEQEAGAKPKEDVGADPKEPSTQGEAGAEWHGESEDANPWAQMMKGFMNSLMKGGGKGKGKCKGKWGKGEGQASADWEAKKKAWWAEKQAWWAENAGKGQSSADWEAQKAHWEAKKACKAEAMRKHWEQHAQAYAGAQEQHAQAHAGSQAASGQPAASQPAGQQFDWAQHMSQHMGAQAAAGQPAGWQHMLQHMGAQAQADWTSTPWGQQVLSQLAQSAAAQPSAPAAEDVEMTPQQPQDKK